MKPLINWEMLQSLQHTQYQNQPVPPPDPGKFWDNQAPMYDQMSKMEKAYTKLQIDAMPIEKHDTVLDIGCGPGRITSMIASRVHSVTSVDASPKMLQYCETNCKSLGLDNVTTQLMNWHEILPGDTIKKHDIVIASRSVAMQDIKKLNALANKAAVLVCWANAPHIPVILGEMFKDISEADRSMLFTPNRQLGYNVTFNLVYDLGLDPNISIMNDGFTKTYSSRDEAYADLRRLRPFPDEKLPVFRKNLEPLLKDNKDGSVTFERLTKSYVLWWEPKPIETDML